MLVTNAALLGLHALFTNTLDESPRTQQVIFGALRFLSGASANFYTIALVLGKSTSQKLRLGPVVVQGRCFNC